MPGSSFSRYRNLAVVEIDGKRSVAQRPDKLPAAASGSATHVVIAGETLDMLADRYYGHEALWWRIADANDTKYLFALAAGDQIVIPPLRTATATTVEGGK
jgi:nucleoid-associated protein YgaU